MPDKIHILRTKNEQSPRCSGYPVSKSGNLRWMQVVYELHKIQIQIRRIISAKYTTFWLPNGFRHSIAGFAGVFAA